jgi:tetratricopeptide (TPR) repeat protein
MKASPTPSPINCCRGRLYLVDTRYWRAMDEYQLGRLDEAWNDIEESKKLFVNALVPKLAGLIAYRRQQIDVARDRFEESRQRNAEDCETGFYLGMTLADLKSWTRSAEVLIDAVRCFDSAERVLTTDIARIRISSESRASWSGISKPVLGVRACVRTG